MVVRPHWVHCALLRASEVKGSQGSERRSGGFLLLRWCPPMRPSRPLWIHSIRPSSASITFGIIAMNFPREPFPHDERSLEHLTYMIRWVSISPSADCLPLCLLAEGIYGTPRRSLQHPIFRRTEGKFWGTTTTKSTGRCLQVQSRLASNS